MTVAAIPFRFLSLCSVPHLASSFLHVVRVVAHVEHSEFLHRKEST